MIRGIFIAAVTLLVASGCASGGEPSERALHESNSTVFSGIDAGIYAIESKDVISLQVRHNPCRCPAPDFEIHIRGEWKRVIVDGEPGIVGELRERTEAMESIPGLHYLWLEGQFNGAAQFDETRVEYPRFDVVDFRVDE